MIPFAAYGTASGLMKQGRRGTSSERSHVWIHFVEAIVSTETFQ
jgi:hypothetical protein